MLIIAVILLGFVAIVVLVPFLAMCVIWIDMIFDRPSLQASGAYVPDDVDEITVVLKGILARGYEQIAPIKFAFDGTHVCVFDYGDEHLDVIQTAKAIAAYIDTALRRGQRVHLVGISFGGNIAPLVVERITAPKENLRLSLVDSPMGVTSLNAIPPFLGGAAKWVLAHLRPGKLTNRVYGHLVLRLMTVPPKRENILVPPGVNALAYQDEVIAKAKAGLQGHAFSMWWAQLSFMASNNIPYSALGEISEVKYYWCGLGEENVNDVVRQPQSMQDWKSHVPNLDSVHVESTHAGFLEKRQTWLTALSE